MFIVFGKNNVFLKVFRVIILCLIYLNVQELMMTKIKLEKRKMIIETKKCIENLKIRLDIAKGVVQQ